MPENYEFKNGLKTVSGKSEKEGLGVRRGEKKVISLTQIFLILMNN